MSLKSRAAFSGSGVVAPNLAPAMQALNNVGNMLTDYEKSQALATQQAIANKRADALLGIQQAQEGRQQSAFDETQAKKQAIAAAAGLQTNVLSGQPGQQRFEEAMTSAVPKFETPKQQKFDYYKQSDAIAQLPAEQRQAATAKLQADYAALGDKDLITARDKYFEDMGTKYAHVSEASNFDGLKVNKADAGYKNRVYNELVKSGTMTPAEAMQQATIQASLYAPAPLTKAQQKDKEAAMKRADEQLKMDLDIAKTATEKMKVTGGKSSTGSKSRFGKYTIEKAADTLKLEDGWTEDTRQNAIDAAEKLRVKHGLPEGLVADALFQAAEKKGWINKDKSVDKDILETYVLNLQKIKEKMGDNFSTKLYSKYGPDYLTKAEGALEKHAKQLQAITAGYSQADAGDTGLATLESQYGRLGLPVKDNLKSTKEPIKKTKVPVEDIPEKDVTVPPVVTQDIFNKKQSKNAIDAYKRKSSYDNISESTAADGSPIYTATSHGRKVDVTDDVIEEMRTNEYRNAAKAFATKKGANGLKNTTEDMLQEILDEEYGRHPAGTKGSYAIEKELERRELLKRKWLKDNNKLIPTSSAVRDISPAEQETLRKYLLNN